MAIVIRNSPYEKSGKRIGELFDDMREQKGYIVGHRIDAMEWWLVKLTSGRYRYLVVSEQVMQNHDTYYKNWVNSKS